MNIYNNRFNRLLSILVSLSLLITACGGGSSGSTSGGNPSGTGNIAPPIISSIIPNAGVIGSTVRIEGLLFGTTVGLNTVQFNGITASIVSASDKVIVVQVPVTATTGSIQVTTANGSKNSSKVFNVLTDTTTPGKAWKTRLNGTPKFAKGLAFDGTTTVIVGNGVYTSTNNLVWQDQNTSLSANDVIWDGQLFLAVGGGLGTHTSNDGNIWNSQTTNGAPDLYSVVKTSTVWVAVGQSGTIRTSPDARIWTTQTTPTTETLTKIAWNGTTLVAVGQNGTVLTSNDHINWTVRVAGVTNTFNALGASPSLFVASTLASANSVSQILTSPDGITWTSQATGLGSFSDIIYDSGQWVAVGQYKVATSLKGIQWTINSATPTNNIGLLNSVIFNGSEYLGVGNTGYSSGGLYSSNDAITWKLVSSNQRLQTIARSSVDGRLVVSGISEKTLTSIDNGTTWQHSGGFNNFVGYLFIDVEWSGLLNKFVALVQEAANTGIYTSNDALNWTRIANGASNRGLASSSSLLLNFGGGTNRGTISTSVDGIKWTIQTNPATQTLNDAIWTGTQFLAYGSAGNVITSADGIIWTKRNSGVTETLNAAVASATLIIIAGTNGTIITSGDDGVSWIKQDSTTSFNLNAVEWTGKEFVAVGSNGKAIRSVDGINWVEQATPYNEVFFQADYYHLNGLVWTGGVNGSLVTVGDRGLIVTSP